MNDLPTLGAALRLESLHEFKDWILEDQRDLEIQDPTYNFPMGEWKEKAAFWHNQMSDYRGRHGVHGPYDGIALASRDPEVQDFAQSKLIDCLDFCEAISATHCVIHSPFHFLGSSAACHTPSFGLEGLLDSAVTTLDPIVQRAAEIGCILVVENIFDRHTAPLHTLVEAIDSPYLQRSIDTGHAQISYKTAGGPSPEFCILEADQTLEHIHLQDTNGENDYHWTPGLGDINWPGVFHAIQSIQAAPRLILEVKDIKGAWKYLSQQNLAR